MTRRRDTAPTWTKAEDDVLRARYGDPNHSAANIGREIGRKRNAVIGRAYRIGLSTKKNAPKKVGGKTYKTPSLRKF